VQPEIRQVWETILSLLEKGQAVLVASDEHGLPTIHNFYRRDPEKGDRYRKSIKHCGFGFFEGETERGEFSFDGGGAMRHVSTGRYDEKGRRLSGTPYESLSWCPLRTSPEVLEDLGYDVDAVKQIVKAKLG